MRFRFALVPIAIVAAAPALLCGCGNGSAARAARPPTVVVANVVERDVSVTSEWVATLDGYVNAQIQPQVTGYLVRQAYREGTLVHKDQVLFEIDPRPFQAALDLAMAQLGQAEAQLGNARLNVKRDVPEAEAGAIPQSQLDTDTQTELAARAAAAGANAAVEQARLNLGFTKVRSLISGIAGIAQVQVGNLVMPTTVLTAVSEVDPIKAYFPVSAEEYLRMADRISADTADLLAKTPAIPLQLILADGTTYPHPGRILFADRAVDPQTGTIRLAGAWPNPGNVLRPGQYGKVRAATEVLHRALLVPQRAVTQLQGAYQVAVVGTDDRIAILPVQVGPRVGSSWVISTGLKPGERVVAEGTQKASAGTLVSPVPYSEVANGANGASGS
jgi:membrane fusion protein (multidrug efflux system)